jgi:hypothetical protein
VASQVQPPAFKPQLLTNIVAMKINSAGFARERLSNVLCTLAGHDHLSNFGFSRGQALENTDELICEGGGYTLQVGLEKIQISASRFRKAFVMAQLVEVRKDQAFYLPQDLLLERKAR